MSDTNSATTAIDAARLELQAFADSLQDEYRDSGDAQLELPSGAAELLRALDALRTAGWSAVDRIAEYCALDESERTRVDTLRENFRTARSIRKDRP